MSLHFSPSTFSYLGGGGVFFFFFLNKGWAHISNNRRRKGHVNGRCKSESNYSDKL